MYKIVFSGRALVDNGKDNGDGTIALTEESAILKSLDGLSYEDEAFSDYLADDEETAFLADDISGGILTFEYIDSQDALIGSIEYQAGRKLSSDDVEILKAYTIDQLLEGIGSNFTQERMLNGEPTPFIHHEEWVVKQSR